MAPGGSVHSESTQGVSDTIGLLFPGKEGTQCVHAVLVQVRASTSNPHEVRWSITPLLDAGLRRPGWRQGSSRVPIGTTEDLDGNFVDVARVA